MKATRTALVTVAYFLLLGGASQAQWLNHPSPAIPAGIHRRTVIAGEAFCDGHDKTMEHRRITPPAPEPPSATLRN